MPRARRRGRDNWAGNAIKRGREFVTGADSESGYESSDHGEVGIITTTTPTPTTTAAPQGSSISKEQKKYDESTEYLSNVSLILFIFGDGHSSIPDTGVHDYDALSYINGNFSNSSWRSKLPYGDGRRHNSVTASQRRSFSDHRAPIDCCGINRYSISCMIYELEFA